jgi:hypothetical protein
MESLKSGIVGLQSKNAHRGLEKENQKKNLEFQATKAIVDNRFHKITTSSRQTNVQNINLSSFLVLLT